MATLFSTSSLVFFFDLQMIDSVTQSSAHVGIICVMSNARYVVVLKEKRA